MQSLRGTKPVKRLSKSPHKGQLASVRRLAPTGSFANPFILRTYLERFGAIRGTTLIAGFWNRGRQTIEPQDGNAIVCTTFIHFLRSSIANAIHVQSGLMPRVSMDSSDFSSSFKNWL